MEKEQSPLDMAYKPFKPIATVVKQEVSEQVASTAMNAAAKLLRMSGKSGAAGLATTLEKIGKRAKRE